MSMVSRWMFGSPRVWCHVLPDGQPHVHEHHSAAAHPGHRVIAVCGKGGVGKSALCAMMTHALSHNQAAGRLLVVDADPALGLALALGIEPQNTIAGVRDALLAAATSGSAAAEREIAGRLDYLVFQSLVECEDYAFLAMGRSRDLGCYCSVNDLLRDAVELLAADFDTVLIDGEAGLEQVNRQVVSAVDDLVVVSDGSARAQRTVATLWDMAAQNNLVEPGRFHLVYNMLPADACAAWHHHDHDHADGHDHAEAHDHEAHGHDHGGCVQTAVAPLAPGVSPHVLGAVPANETVASYDREGLPLFDLPHDNPANHAVWHICEHLVEG